MTKTKRATAFIAAALAAVFAVGMAGCGKRDEGEYVIPEYADDKQLEIAVWEVPSRRKMTQEGFDEVADAGYSLLMPLHDQCDFDTNPQKALDYLDKTQKAGMRALVHDSAIVDGNNLTAPADPKNIDLYKDHPAFEGISIKDEPQSSMFGALKIKHAQVKELFPDKIGMINLNPMWASDIEYRQYVSSFLDTVEPDVLSYDEYCLFKDGSVRANHFANLEMVRWYAQEKGVTPSYIMLLSGHYTNMWEYRTPTEEDLRWQMASAMAYGYPWITHYCYGPTATGPGGKEGNYDELINSQGETTALYDDVKRVNLEVRAWDHVYMSFDWLGTAAITGTVSNVSGMFSQIWHVLEIEDMDGVQSVVSSRDLLMGAFKDDQGRNGYMAVNATNPDDGLDATVTVRFDPTYKGVQVYEKGVARIYDLDERNEATFRLESGEGKFLIPLVKK